MSRTRRVDDEVSKSMIYNQEDMSLNLGSVESTFFFFFKEVHVSKLSPGMEQEDSWGLLPAISVTSWVINIPV